MGEAVPRPVLHHRAAVRRAAAVATAAALLALPAWGGPAATAAPAAGDSTAGTASAPDARWTPPWARETIHERRIIGRSVKGRPIYAYRLGQPGRKKVVLISVMHGDEPRPREILRSFRDGSPVRGVTLWIIPTYNPDGIARGTRKNARGVDLNRNFPYRWANLNGHTESGSGPRSEPETRAVMRFLDRVNPFRIVSFHQPLHGVDTDTKSPEFSRRLATQLRLPRKSFNCSGVCHGTMTGWFNHNHRGAAVTVEYGPHPPRHRLRVRAPRQLLRVLGGWRPR